MGVDHRGLDILVTEEFLDCPDIVAIFEEVGGEAVAEGVRGDRFVDAGEASGLFDCLLEAGLT